MGDIDFFSDLVPSKATIPAPGLDGIDDIFAAESPVLAQPLSGSPHNAPTQTNGDLGGSFGGGSPFERGDGATSESGRSTAPMGLSAGKRDAQHVEAVLARFATGLEKVLQDSNLRISAMEAKLDNLMDSLDELQTAVGSQHNSAGARWVSLEAAVRELSRGVQLVRDKQEIQDANAELSRLSTKSPSAASQVASPRGFPTAPPVAAATALPPPPAAVATAPAAAVPSAPPALQQAALPVAPPAQLAGPQLPLPEMQQQQQQQQQQPQQQHPDSAQQYTPQYGVGVPPGSHQQPHPHPHPQQQQQQQQQYSQQQPQAPQVPQYAAASQAQPAQLQQAYGQQASPVYSAPPLPFAGREAPPATPFGYAGAAPQQSAGQAPPPASPYGQVPSTSASIPHGPTHGPPPTSSPGGAPMQRYDPGPPPPQGGPPPQQPQHQYGPPPPHMQGHMGGPPQPPPPPPAGLWRGPQPTTGQYRRPQPSQGPPPRPPSSAGDDAGSRRMDLPLERVIDDVAGMGFSRHEVRDVVVAMMQSGQAVDLNLVVDRLMSRNQ